MRSRSLLVLAAGLALQWTPAAGQTHFRTIHRFGKYPAARAPIGVVAGPSGSLFGVAAYGGVFGDGAFYELQPPAASGAGWNASTLYSFAPQNGDGYYPVASLTAGPDGALYGTTAAIDFNYGTVFQLLPPASPGANWSENVLFRAAVGTGAYYLTSSVAVSSNGDVYGASGTGAIFKLMKPRVPGRDWTQSIIYTFDNLSPVGIMMGSHGELYGATYIGGTSDRGAIFLLRPPKSGTDTWTETTLHSFIAGTDGANPTQPPIIGPNGALYGTTSQGGSGGQGIVFELQPPSKPGGTWTENILFNFSSPADGKIPSSPLLLNSGIIYGTTATGFGPKATGGTVFALQPPSTGSGPWAETILHTFTGVNEPWGALAMDANGMLYGTTNLGLAYQTEQPTGRGAIYRIKPSLGKGASR